MAQSEGDGLTDEELEEARLNLFAFLQESTPDYLHVYINSDLNGREPTFEELLFFLIKMRTTSPDSLMREYFLKNPLYWIRRGAQEAPRLFFESMNERDYDRAWNAFIIWFSESGIRDLSTPADAMMAFDEWRRGEGGFENVLLSSLPISIVMLGGIINRIDSPQLREALQGLARNRDNVPVDELLNTLIRHSDDVGQANFSHLLATGSDFGRIMRHIDERGIVLILTDPNLIRTLGTTTEATEIARLINLSVLTNAIPGIGVLTQELNLASTQRLLRVLDRVDTGDPTRLVNLVNRLDANRTNDFLRHIDDASLIRMLNNDGNVIVGNGVDGLNNTTYGISRNTTSGEDIAIEMQFTGKSDPNIGILIEVPGYTNPVELDWINRTSNGIELVDVKNINPPPNGRSAYDIRLPEIWPGQHDTMTTNIIEEATRQLDAMSASGADNVVWRLSFPSSSDMTTNQAIADAIQGVFNSQVDLGHDRFRMIIIEIITEGR